MEEITVEKIKSRIKENLQRAGAECLTKELCASTETIKPFSASKDIPVLKIGTAANKNANALLWKYGTKYSRIIKSIPILSIIAEKYYWKLSFSQMNMTDNKVSLHFNSKGVDFMDNNWHFHNNLREIKNAGLKGKIKLFIFRLIGFFAFWQEQKNKALFHELTNLRAEIIEKDKTIEGMNKTLSTINRTQDALYQDLTNLRAEIIEKDKTIEGMNKTLSTINRTQDALYQDLTNLRAEIIEKDKAIEETLQLKVEGLRKEFTDRASNFENIMSKRTEKETNFDNVLHSDIKGLKEIIEKKTESFNDLNRYLNFVSRKVELLNYELKKRAGIEVDQSIKEIANKDFSPESYTYFAFENIFRGSRDTIKKRQSQYLNHIYRAYQKSNGAFHLDLGSGRGEFLEILTEQNIPAKGVDINEENINICLEFNLNAELADALNYLRTIKNNSLIGITAFQVVEHLNAEYILELIKASFQKIKEDGVIILETVNPYSLYSLSNFFIDMTHRNPISPVALKFLVEASGFMNVEILYSSPVSDEIKLKGDDENTKKLNEILFGFQDYAVVGWK
jgi:O-antigen chain-terminating methyltransferase